MVAENNLTFDGGHTMQYTDHVSWKCTLETYINLNKCHPNEFNNRRNI